MTFEPLFRKQRDLFHAGLPGVTQQLHASARVAAAQLLAGSITQHASRTGSLAGEMTMDAAALGVHTDVQGAELVRHVIPKLADVGITTSDAQVSRPLHAAAHTLTVQYAIDLQKLSSVPGLEPVTKAITAGLLHALDPAPGSTSPRDAAVALQRFTGVRDARAVQGLVDGAAPFLARLGTAVHVAHGVDGAGNVTLQFSRLPAKNPV